MSASFWTPLISSADAIDRLETVLMGFEQADLPLNHTFTPGIYTRELFLPAGTVAVGRTHKTEHLNIILCGKAIVRMGDRLFEVTGPTTFVAKPGARKAVMVLEDMRWANVHPNEFGMPSTPEEEKEILAKIEAQVVEKKTLPEDRKEMLEAGQSLKDELAGLFRAREEEVA